MNKTKERQQVSGGSRETAGGHSSRARWTGSNSKFNRILGNLERSIFGNHVSQSHEVDNSGSTKVTTKQQSANKTTSKRTLKQQQQQQQSQGATRKVSSDGSQTTTNATTQQGNTNHQRQVDPLQSSRADNITSSASTSTLLSRNLSSTSGKAANMAGAGALATEQSQQQQGNMTLNKFQQQLASTLRPNHRQLVSNKLSIPPPHANGEARSQNQHSLLLFANNSQNAHSSMLASSSNASSRLPFDAAKASLEASSSLLSSKNMLTSTLSRLNLNKINQSNNNNSQHNKFADAEAAIRRNSSPASSAKSLPALKSGSQLPKSNYKQDNAIINEDEDSGFSTYQSRRSILAENQAQTASIASSSLATTASLEQQPQQQPSSVNNMIRIPSDQLMANGAMLNYSNNNHNQSNNLNNHFVAYQQNQYLFDYNHQQQAANLQQVHNQHNLRQQQQQQPCQIYGQQQLAQSNQVPILTTVNPSNINYRNPTIDHHHHHNNHQQTMSRNASVNHQLASQPQPQFHSQMSTQAFSDPRANNNTTTTTTTTTTNNLYGSYPTGSNAVGDTNRPIYANAPPKPRRYQYYDVGTNRQLFLSQHQPNVNNAMTTGANPQTMTTKAANFGAGPQLMQYNQQIFQNRQQMQQMHQQQGQQIHQSGMLVNHPNQHLSSSSYLSVPSLHQNNEPKPSTQRPQTIRDITYLDHHQQHQHQHHQNYFHPPPQPLIKSKSSLDASDLARLRQNRQPNNHIQSIINGRQQYHLIQEAMQPIYGSRPVAMNNLYKQQLQQSQPALAPFPSSNSNQFDRPPLQVGGNLQRSKSVTHLLPENEPLDPSMQRMMSNFSIAANGNPQPIIVGPSMTSSNSTTNLHLLGAANQQAGQTTTMSTQGQFPQLTRHQSSYNLNCGPTSRQQYYPVQSNRVPQTLSSLPLPPVPSPPQKRQHQQPVSGQWAGNHQLMSNLHESQANNDSLNPLKHPQQSQQASKQVKQPTLNTATTTVFSNNANKQLIGHPPGDSFIQQDTSDGLVKQSLDDKIRHLLIGSSDYNNESFVGLQSGAAAAATANTIPTARGLNQSDNVIYQTAKTSANNNNAGLSCSSSSPSSSAAAAAAATTALAATQQDTRATTQEHPNRHASSNNLVITTTTTTTSSASLAGTSNQTQFQPNDGPQTRGNSIHNEPNNVARSLLNNQFDDDQQQHHHKTRSNMGNRQQRQYDLSKHRPSLDAANSHLIVDLTTPRVLAKTQTTLMSATSSSNNNHQQPPPTSRDAWSINQVGLPSVVVTGANQSRASSRSEPADSKVDNKQTTSRQDFFNKQDLPPPPASTKSNDHCERSAPYYYSDLKSDEQRQALLNVVQQKSLSPPPQLLSRAADLSHTRLTSKSATLHPGHARLLSESLAQRRLLESLRQRTGNDIDGAGGHYFSSATNIAKNIDKLFDSPSIQSASTQIPAVQSMLALNDTSKDTVDSVGHHPASLYPRKSLVSMNNDTMVSLSKSKSLENISQKSNTDLSAALSLINPVYENILRSDRLMNAIKDSPSPSSTCLLAANNDRNNNNSNNNSHQQQLKPLARISAASDESMDSILGSSLENSSDSSSDIIDEIKVSSSDNHLSDISQLIDQLKSNHSKLTEEYKSTLIRISKTINSNKDNTKRMGSGDSRPAKEDEKLARRLHLLELKSKKCESRSRNQLALIQMMEKVLRQSKLRVSSSPAVSGGCGGGGNSNNDNSNNRFLNHNSSQASIEEDEEAVASATMTPTVLNNNNNSSNAQPGKPITAAVRQEQLGSESASLSFDYQSAKQTVNNSSSSKTTTSASSDNNNKQQQQQNGLKPQTNSNHRLDKQPDVGKSQASSSSSSSSSCSSVSRPSKEIIKAIVTETKSSGEFVRTSSSPLAKAAAAPVDSQTADEATKANTTTTTTTTAGSNGHSSKTKDLVAKRGAGGKKSNGISQRIQDIERRSAGGNRRQHTKSTLKSNNPFCDDGRRRVDQSSSEEEDDDDEDDDDEGRRSSDGCAGDRTSGDISDASNPSGQSNKRPSTTTRSGDHVNQQLAASLMRDGGASPGGDDDDFIEFMSSSSSHRSQFEASQFSASDFNTSTSASESSAASNAGNDSLNSLISPKGGGSTTTTSNGRQHPTGNMNGDIIKSGILKKSKHDLEGIGGAGGRHSGSHHDRGFLHLKHHHCQGRAEDVDSDEEDDDDEDEDDDESDDTSETARPSSRKFNTDNNNVFGNVIDVDVCPQVNNGTSCLN